MTASNSINKIARRTVAELEGLLISILEDSKRVNTAVLNNVFTPPTRLDNNTMEKISRRTFGELSGLFFNIIERSKRELNVSGTFKIMKPRKKYKATLKLYRSYDATLKLHKNYSTTVRLYKNYGATIKLPEGYELILKG